MFTKLYNNRNMSPEDNNTGGGSVGDNIIISGNVDDRNKPTPPVTPPTTPPTPGVTGAPPATPPATPPVTPTETFIEIKEDSDKLLKEYVIGAYNDLSLVKLNKTGDLVNLEGTVLVKKTDLDTSLKTIKDDHVAKAKEYIKSTESVEIEGKEYKIAEDGSVKDADGNVLLTSEALIEQIMSGDDYLKDGVDIDSIYKQAEQISGLRLVDDKGNEIEFEETAEGLARRDLHIARQEGARIAQDAIGSFFGQYPDLENAFYYYKAKGSLNGFGTQTNHEGITIDVKNESQMMDIVVEAELMRGYTREQAIKRANLFKENDMLAEEAKDGLTFMVNKEKADKEAVRIAYETKQAEIAAEQAKYWNEVASKLQIGKILDYNIPENIRVADLNGIIRYYSKQDFLDYMRVPVKDGLTQAQIDANNESIDQKIFNDYLRFVGHDMSYIVNQRVKQAKVNDLKSRFTQGAIPKRKVIVNNPAKSDDRILL